MFLLFLQIFNFIIFTFIIEYIYLLCKGYCDCHYDEAVYYIIANSVSIGMPNPPSVIVSANSLLSRSEKDGLPVIDGSNCLRIASSNG